MKIRDLLLPSVATAELLFAVCFAIAAFMLPGAKDVQKAATSATAASTAGVDQVSLLRKSVSDLKDPKLKQVIERLEALSQSVAQRLKNQQIDFDTVKTVRDALGDSATGLDTLAMTIDPSIVEKVGSGLEETASFLDGKLAPGAEQAAARIESATAAAQEHGRVIKEFLERTPLDLDVLRQTQSSLKQFAEAAKQTEQSIDSFRAEKVVEALRGAAGIIGTLASAADTLFLSGQAKQLSDIKNGLDEVAKGVALVNETMLPNIKEALSKTSAILDDISNKLETALSQQDEIEALLKQLPELVARTSDEIPRIGADLAGILRETGRIKATAESLRQANRQISRAVESVPTLQASLGRGSAILRASQKQLDQAVANRDTFDNAMNQTHELLEAFRDMMNTAKSQLVTRAEEEDRILDEMSQVCVKTRDAIPGIEAMVVCFLRITRGLFCLGAVVLFGHGILHLGYRHSAIRGSQA